MELETMISLKGGHSIMELTYSPAADFIIHAALFCAAYVIVYLTSMSCS
jgi:hypothetical protein